MVNIIYEDSHIIVCVKSFGLLSQSDGSGSDSVLSLLEMHRVECGEDRYVGAVHRLDRATGGVMVFAKTKKDAAALSSSLAADAHIKEYRTVVYGTPETTHGRLTDYLRKETASGTVKVCDAGAAGARRAELEYFVLGNASYKRKDISLLSVRLYTGRTHQIRVQFSSRGMPVLGDAKYGSREPSLDNMALWSYRMSFAHPASGKQLEFRAEVPDTAPWDLFSV